jgi:hypothetical protein
LLVDVKIFAFSCDLHPKPIPAAPSDGLVR